MRQDYGWGATKIYCLCDYRRSITNYLCVRSLGLLLVHTRRYIGPFFMYRIILQIHLWPPPFWTSLKHIIPNFRHLPSPLYLPCQSRRRHPPQPLKTPFQKICSPLQTPYSTLPSTLPSPPSKTSCLSVLQHGIKLPN
jgi:hypothetical protein